MRNRRLWIVAAAAVFSHASPVDANAAGHDLLDQPQSVRPLTLGESLLDFDEYATVSAEGTTKACSYAASSCGCDDACSGGCQCNCRDGLFQRWLDNDPVTLPQVNMLDKLGIHAGGWVQAGITLNGRDPADDFNGPLLTNDQHGQLQMNQLWFYLHRPVDTGGDGIDIGGRVDFFYGTDWRVAYLHSFGLEGDLSGATLNGSNQLYGVSFPQFYAEVAINDFSVKIGHMTGIMGYEIVPPMGNFFYSHSYALSYGEPILITGLMSTYKVSDQISVLAGVHQGLHQFAENNGHASFQGGVFWNSEDERLSIGYSVDAGRNDFIFPLEDEFLQSLVVKYQLTPDLLYVLQNDIGWAEGTPGNPDAEWYGINQYLFYTINEAVSAGVRVEWFRDDDGTRVLGLGNLDAQGWSAPSGTPGFSGSFTELTMGLNIKPKANISIRPELRWDWYDGTTNPNGLLPFDAGSSDNQFTFATDVILTF